MPQQQGTGNVHINSTFVNGSLIFYNEDTGATIFTISTSGVTLAGNNDLDDDQSLRFGDSNDVAIKWTTTGTNRLTVVPVANNSILEIGDGASLNMDLKLQGAASTLTWDASQNTLITKNNDVQFVDNDNLVFGSGAGIAGDVAITWTTTGTNRLTVMPVTNNSIFEIGNGTLNMDFRLHGAASTLIFDASQNTLITDNVDVQFRDDDKAVFGTGAGIAGDFQLHFDGTRLLLEPQTDDLVFRIGKVGATQLSPDVEIYGNAANGADKFTFDAGASALIQTGAAEIRLGRMTYAVVTAKTSNYTVTAAETGTIFHTTGAGATVAFTLPAKAAGLTYKFFNTVDQGMKIVADAADTLVVFNDVAADDIRFYTAGEKIGAAVEVVATAAKWFVLPLMSSAKQTMTVTT